MVLMISYMHMHIQKQDQTEDLLKASRVDVLLEDMVKGFLNTSLFFAQEDFYLQVINYLSCFMMKIFHIFVHCLNL
jgi:glycerol-3-phosphate acyltransferase PlsY